MSIKNLSSLLFDLKKRRIISNIANEEFFLNLDNKKRVIYFGVDCTAESLHIGHFFQLIQLFRFSCFDFKILFLFGGATSKIGDPSDKNKERFKIKEDSIKNYQRIIKEQIFSLIDRKEHLSSFSFNFSPLEFFFDIDLLNKIYEILEIDLHSSFQDKWKIFISFILPNGLDRKSFVFLTNSEWLESLNCVDFLDIVGRNVSVNYLLSKHWVKERIKNGLSYSAFSYSLLQAYDFYYLFKNHGCYGQVGGSDQWGNMTTALKIMHGLVPNNEFFAFSFSLLSHKGAKISKTDNKYLLLNSMDYQKFFDFFCNMPDEQIKEYILKFTFISLEQVDKLIELNNPSKLRILQRILLETVWFFIFGELDSFRKIVFSRKK